MYEQIDAYVGRCLSLNTEELGFFHSCLEHKVYKKKTFLLREGMICDFEAYILKGCIRSYYVDEKGEETILMFAVEDWWVSDIASFSEGKPSLMFIETVEDTEVLQISRKEKEKLFRQVPQFERMFRLMVQRSLSELQQRFFYFVSRSARERYLSFLHKYPGIAQRVPQHQIARYLGISPEFLSKIRSELAHH